VLDGNDRNPEHKTAWQYERFISAEQIQWLEDDLDKTHLPTIVFCHQGLDTEGGIENAVRVRIAFERTNQRSGFRKVVLVFSGHHHQDYHNVFNGIHYIQINSASYHWQGHQYAESPFSEELNRKYPLIKYMAHYKDPLWAFVQISPTGDVSIHGRASTFVGKTPVQLGMPADEYAYPVVPFISSRKIGLTLEPITSDALGPG
jgi:3',5'-cyclic AMP phosphodiesterase CpdA